MPQTPVEIELEPDFKDYRRAALRLLMMRRPFQILLLLTAVAILFALVMVIRTAPAAGLSRAVLAQAPILVFGIVPVTIYVMLLGQGQRMIAQQRKVNERTYYRFTDEGFDLRITSDAGDHERKGQWTDFVRVVETDEDFMLFLPGFIGIPLPKHYYKSAEDIGRFREYARKNLGGNALVWA